MHHNHGSLISFTLLAQFSVGIVLFITLAVFGGQQNMLWLNSGPIIQWPVFWALIFVAAATIISFSHLGKPQHATHAMSNIGSSWLSREILGVTSFGVGVLLVFLLKWLFPGGQLLIKFVLIYSVVAGLLLLYSMARIYRVTTIPAWNSWYTSWSFFMSALLAGVFTVSVFAGYKQASADLLPGMLRAGAGLLLLQLGAAVLYHHQLLKIAPVPAGRPAFDSGSYHALYLIRLFMLFIAASFSAFLAANQASWSAAPAAAQRFLLFILFLVLIQEIAGRYQFYARYFRVGV